MCCCAALLSAVTALLSCEAVSAIPPQPPLQALTIVDGGVVWFDDGPVLFRSFRSGSTTRLAANAYLTSSWPRQVPSSATAVGADTGGLAGVPPRPLVRISRPAPFAGFGCKAWEPGGDEVVVEDEIVAAGACSFEDRYTRRPLFFRSVLRGPWRVLRWLPGEVEPVLAAEGPLLAVGVPTSSARMEVKIFDVRSGRVRAGFVLRDGYLSFASPDRLVLSEPAPRAADEVDFPLYEWSGGPFQLSLYSTHGRLLARLGSAQEPPLVSGMHLVTVEQETVSVRSVTGGSTRAVIGFNAPARALDAVAFRWPALVVAETSSDPLLASEVCCWTGDYGPPSKAFLGIFDLARDEPFVAPPALVHVEPSRPLTGCGPLPP